MADDEFQKQLELEALEKKKKEQGDWGSSYSDPYTYVDPNDGTTYEWNSEKNAWFPKVDENFLASYHANYNYNDQGASNTISVTSSQAGNSSIQKPVGGTQEGKAEKRKANNEPSWFEVDEAHNTNVYVSNLPVDTTDEEFIELMSKCGLIMKDPETMKYKIKLYRHADGTPKGDGRCCYIKVESVDLALNILDGYRFKGKEIHVERAQFQLKGAYDPSKKPKKKKSKDKEKLKKRLEKLFDWRPDKLRGMRLKHEKTVIIKNMFDPKEFENDATLLLDYQKDLREECSKFGEVKKVVIYDRNPEGVVAVTFAEPEMADECLTIMNGRWFAARQLTAETWDGRTKYKIAETETEKEKRMKQWDNFLHNEDNTATAAAERGTSTKTDKTSISSVECKGNGSTSQNSYELAGDTESSGDSDDENDVEPVSSTSNTAWPVMRSHGQNKGFFVFPVSVKSDSRISSSTDQ